MLTNNDILLTKFDQGIWAGMIFGGTAIQTLILCLMTIRCDWNKEVSFESVYTHIYIYMTIKKDKR